MRQIFRRLLKDEAGVTAIEYGLIASLIIVFIASVLLLVGNELNTTFQNVANAL